MRSTTTAAPYFFETARSAIRATVQLRYVQVRTYEKHYVRCYFTLAVRDRRAFGGPTEERL